MIRRLVSRLRHFRRNESGNATVELLFWFPFFMVLTYSGVDMAILAFNHANLERGLDETIRDVRLNNIAKYDPTPGATWDHDMLKKIVCDKALYLPNCNDSIALEMKSIDPRGGEGLNPKPFCVDTPEEIRKPEDQVFEPGASNELMIIRACIEVSPIWISTMLGSVASRRPDGQYELHATTVFVHEPV